MISTRSIYPPVFFPALVLIISLAGFAILFPDLANFYFSSTQSWIITNFGWIYILSMAIFICLSFIIMISKYGEIKLGHAHEEPDYNTVSWFAMLFATGMGIGLMFYSVAEPVQHYLEPPSQSGETISAAKNAMNITFFHWGIHAWSVYGVLGMAIAYFGYRYKLPLLPRSALYPFLGERIYGGLGHAIDVFAIFGTMFGIATSLGLGASQVSTGLNYLFGLPQNNMTQSLLIAIITAITAISVASGLDKGLKLLSNLNLVVVVILLAFILFVGNTIALIGDYLQNIGTYLSSLVNKTMNIYAYRDKNEWLSGWTLFYWGWWIAWSPFVGMVIAKVSRGRTIRQFLIGVLFVPAGFTFLFLTILGNSAIELIQTGNEKLLMAVTENLPVALFVFLESFPFPIFFSIISLVLVVCFFVTSADAGSQVINTIATGDARVTYAWQKVLWAMAEGVLAIALLFSGGLQALQVASIISALPMALILLLICVAFVKAVRKDYLKTESIKTHQPTIQYASAASNWKERLDKLLSLPDLEQAQHFLQEVAYPSLKHVHEYMREKGIDSYIRASKKSVKLIIKKPGEHDFVYSVRLRVFNSEDLFQLLSANQENTESKNYYRAEVFLEHGGQLYDIMGYEQKQVISDVITQYEKHLYYLHISLAHRSFIEE